MGILSILVLCLVQAGFFAILHSGVLAKHFLLGLIWFVATLYGGIIPAMVGHTVANLTYRFKARAHHGWYDED